MLSPEQDFAKNLSPSEAMGGKVFEINGQVRLNISKFMVSHDKRQHVLFLFTCSEPRAQTGSASLLASVLCQGRLGRWR